MLGRKLSPGFLAHLPITLYVPNSVLNSGEKLFALRVILTAGKNKKNCDFHYLSKMCFGS